MPGRIFRAAWFSLSILCFGCNKQGPDVPLVPVAGTVTINGAPLTFGVLSFRPDPAKGNTSKYEPAGGIDQEGHYSLQTMQQPGAPAGWYKVLLVAADPVDPKDPYAKRKSHVHEKYNSLETTDLSVEVVANAPPGSYDLKVQP